jgi:thiol-disulfide isomerase/thioredoxin
MTEIFKSLFQNAEENEKPSGNLFDQLNIEEESSDSFINFKTNSNDNKLHLFMFYAPWCGHCKRKKSFLNNLVRNHSSNLKVHTYNCERLKDKFIESINGFPTFKMGYKQKTYDTDLLEFVVFAVALSMKHPIEQVIDNLHKSNLKDKLKDELEHKKNTLKTKMKQIKDGK